jgi:hypothetical protein
MSNFATITDIEAFLQLTITGDAVKEAAAAQALEWASEAIRNYCNQTIDEVLNDVITLDSWGGSRIYLPQLPVLSVDSVVEDGETLTADDDYKLGQWGILHRVRNDAPICWYVGIQIITITYDHGYYDIPDDIIAVCTRAASRAYQAGLKSSDSDGVPGIASKSLGDFSVSFQSEAGGGIGEGLMGASGARVLLLSEKDILDKYRLRGP